MTRAGRVVWFGAVVATWLVLVPAANAQQALVHSPGAGGLEIGQAWLLSASGHCYAVLPAHVVHEAGERVLLLREGRGGERGELDATSDLGDDIAIGVVQGLAKQSCGPTMGSVGRAVGRQLAAGGGSALRTINGDGTVGRSGVLVVDDDGEQWLHVSPGRDQDRVRKGQSGSLLYAGDIPVGMLVSVNTSSGVGRVMRIDALMRKVEAAVRATSTPVVVTSDAAAVQKPRAWEAVAWNVDPSAEGLSARSLTSPEEGRHWLAVFSHNPIYIDFRSPSGIQTVTELELDGRGVDARHLPSRVQILARVGTGGWRAIKTVAPTFASGTSTVRFAPTRAELIRLEIYRGEGQGELLGLRGMTVR
jgi:hypothetical protein